MADIGDVVRHEGLLWKVSSRNRDFGTLVLVATDTTRLEVPADQDLEVLHSTKDWPFVAVPAKSFKHGRIVSVGRNRETLRPLLDWVPSDMLRAGGALFFNPLLGLRVGDILVARHKKGTVSRVTVTKAFGNIQARRRRKAKPWKPQAPATTYDRLMGDDPFGDDD